ncbi:MAG: excinuclease ABC subunit UvrB [Patescibacteria group bacterium]
MSKFKLKSKFKPDGDQPQAIKSLVDGLKKGMKKQTLLGVTGSGKTFTVANVIEAVQKPTLVIAHNKTLAAQLAQEYREFFPDNAVHYFVSYYDFYQPEAYMPITDTYIEKDAQINEEIDRLRHASTQALLTRRDVIIVASVSCIYGLGSPEEYEKENLKISVGNKFSKIDFMRRLVAIHFERTTADITPGTFRSIGNRVEIMPISEKFVWNVEFEGDRINSIVKINPVSQRITDAKVKKFFLFPAKHFITEKGERERAIKDIERELKERLKKLEGEGKLLEVERLRRRTKYDLAMIREVGYCSGIENYSRHLSGKLPGEPPETLLSYFPHKKDGPADFLLIIDESHVTLPQLNGMYNGDASRKKTLVEFGFRLPSAMDNRPLKYAEFEKRVDQTIYTSATPSETELTASAQVVEQIIRPTGLVDPQVTIRPIMEKGKYSGQIHDFIKETKEEIKKKGRVLATTLTKRMAEDLSLYLKDAGIKAEYLHSEIKTIERIQILTSFRKGEFDCLVGVNLLREGLDLPEVSFIGILDADKEGFLRSEVSLIQTIGRAARNSAGRVILYADKLTGSIERALKETNRRREIQVKYNKKHHITPTTIKKKIHDIMEHLQTEHKKAVGVMLSIDQALFEKNPKKFIKDKEQAMSDAVKILDFESAAIIRDEIKMLRGKLETKNSTTTKKTKSRR